ncbi:hypothetical protein FM113_07045 [Leucobacter sp. 7(1)]|nr:hypothetical protein FM113_07045 [Leucobacter sp. 7(1)]
MQVGSAQGDDVDAEEGFAGTRGGYWHLVEAHATIDPVKPCCPHMRSLLSINIVIGV